MRVPGKEIPMNTYRSHFYNATGFRILMQGRYKDPLEGVPDHWPRSQEREHLSLIFPALDTHTDSLTMSFFAAVDVRTFVEALTLAHVQRQSGDVAGFPGQKIYLAPGSDNTYAVIMTVDKDDQRTQVITVALSEDQALRLLTELGQASKLFSE